MKAAKRAAGNLVHVPADDKKLPVEKQTRFTCRPLTQEERMYAWDNLNWTQRDGDGNVTILPRTFRLARELVIATLLSVENLEGATPWPDKGSDEEKGEWLDQLPDMELYALGNAIRNQAFLEDEVKN